MKLSKNIIIKHIDADNIENVKYYNLDDVVFIVMNLIHEKSKGLFVCEENFQIAHICCHKEKVEYYDFAVTYGGIPIHIVNVIEYVDGGKYVKTMNDVLRPYATIITDIRHPELIDCPIPDVSVIRTDFLMEDIYRLLELLYYNIHFKYKYSEWSV